MLRDPEPIDLSAEREKREKVPPFDVKLMSELVEMDIPPREIILAPWLAQRGLALIHAFRGVGKTHFGLAVAYAIATGGEFLRFKAPTPRRVLYVDGEMPADAIKARLLDLGPATDLLGFLSMELQQREMVNIADIGSQADLEKAVAEGDWEVIILDNVQTLVRSGMSASSDESWMAAQDWALRQRADGRSVAFIDHDNRSGGLLGTGTKETVLDTVIHLKRPGDWTPERGAAFDLHFTKTRGFYGEDAAPMAATMKTTEFGVGWEWRSIDASNHDKVVSLARQDWSVTDISLELDLNKSVVSRHIKRAKNGGEL